jgi:hypothetical protein
MIAMLVPMMGVMTSAAELENLYKLSEVKGGTTSATADEDPKPNVNYYCSGKIEVTAGDVITFGPVRITQSYYLCVYDVNGDPLVKQVKHADCTKVDELVPGVEIVKYTIPEGAASFKIAASNLFYENTLVTKNQEFDKAAYYAFMDKAGINVDIVRPTAFAGQITNVFPVSDATFAGRADGKNAEIAAGQYRTCPVIPVKEGDVLYFAGSNLSQTYQLVLVDANGAGTGTVNANYMVPYADFGDGYGIYAYRMRQGTAGVRVVCATTMYDAGKVLCSINQPINIEAYNNYFNPPETTEPAPETTEPAPETTEPAPETTEPGASTPTGDSALVFAAIAMVSLVGVAVIAKKKEN